MGMLHPGERHYAVQSRFRPCTQDFAFHIPGHGAIAGTFRGPSAGSPSFLRTCAMWVFNKSELVSVK
jgi:hypothetical protein